MRVSVPDPSLQLRALDKLSPPLGPSATFRVQTFRSQTLLDQAPSEASVYQFSELLLAEAEDAVLGEAVEKGPKKPNVAKADGQDTPGGKENGGQGQENGGKGKEKGKAKGQTTRQVCNLWRTEPGCKYGKACRFTHDALTPADKRCFNCSSTQHRKPDCPFPKSSGTEGDSAKKSVDTPSAASAKSAPSAPSDQDKSRDELLKKATAVLESLQSSVKAVSCTPQYPPRPKSHEPTGLIDSGATTSMRTRYEGEAIKGTRTVSLAQGEAALGVGGTLLSNDPIEPIVSARQLIALGFRLIWTKRACQLFDEKGVYSCFGRVRLSQGFSSFGTEVDR